MATPRPGRGRAVTASRGSAARRARAPSCACPASGAGRRHDCRPGAADRRRLRCRAQPVRARPGRGWSRPCPAGGQRGSGSRSSLPCACLLSHRRSRPMLVARSPSDHVRSGSSDCSRRIRRSALTRRRRRIRRHPWRPPAGRPGGRGNRPWRRRRIRRPEIRRAGRWSPLDHSFVDAMSSEASRSDGCPLDRRGGRLPRQTASGPSTSQASASSCSRRRRAR